MGVGVAMLLAGCEGGGISSGVTPDVTNAPAPGFQNMQAGSEEDFMLNVGRRTYFSAGSSSLDGTAKVTLDKQAAWLNRHTGWKVKVQGFADDPGSETQNVDLSQKRAAAVRDYLTSKGVDPKRMWIKGYGKARIVKECADVTCKSQNRRVVTNLRDELEE